MRQSKLSSEERRLHRNAASKRHYYRHHEKIKAQNSAWRRKNWQGKLRWDLIKYKYGLTKQQYLDLLNEQDGLCSLCNEMPTKTNNLVVDHCHKTGQIRGLIHRRCNTGIGFFNDDVARVTQALVYLQNSLLKGGF